MQWSVFYAWQSDSPGKTNKNLLQKALEEAIEKVRADGHLDVDPRLDKDTLGVAGAPDIVATIFEKISHAAVFVADVSIVTSSDSAVPAPNPNVLIELGFALHALGSSRVVLVMNTAYGEPELLPFDIRQKRALTYSLNESANEKGPERRRLTETLVTAIRWGLEAAEAEMPRPAPAPRQSELLISAVEHAAPFRRRAARNYFASLLDRIDRSKPEDVSSDDALVSAIEASLELPVEFWAVAQAIAAYQPPDVIEEAIRAFEQLLARYDMREAGAFRETDFDFFKFLGHELFTLLAAAFLGEEAWEPLSALLGTPLHVRSGRANDFPVTYIEISHFTGLLDHTRQQRLRTQTSIRMSVRADILKERYATGPLAEHVGWTAFTEADFFLFLRSMTGRSKDQFEFWRPWSVLYLNQLPEFLLRAEARAYAARVARGLGLTDPAQLGETVGGALKYLEGFYSAGFWRPPGHGFDLRRLASR